MSDDVVVVPRRFCSVCKRAIEEIRNRTFALQQKVMKRPNRWCQMSLINFQYVKRGFGDPIDRRRRLEPFHRDQQADPITIATVPTSAQRQVK
jgi:hypothetical protein